MLRLGRRLLAIGSTESPPGASGSGVASGDRLPEDEVEPVRRHHHTEVVLLGRRPPADPLVPVGLSLATAQLLHADHVGDGEEHPEVEEARFWLFGDAAYAAFEQAKSRTR